MHAHNNPITGFHILVIPDAISWDKVSNFGMAIASHMLFGISFTYQDILKTIFERFLLRSLTATSWRSLHKENKPNFIR